MNSTVLRSCALQSIARAGMALAAACGCTAAQADLVAVVGAGSPANKVSSEQVQAIFLMRLKTLPGAGTPQLVVVGSTRPQLLSALGKSEDQLKAIWARQVFTGGASQPVEVADAAEAKKTLKNPNAVAVIDSAQVDASVKVIAEL